MEEIPKLKEEFAAMSVTERIACLWLLMDEIAKDTGEEPFELLVEVRRRLLWRKYL